MKGHSFFSGKLEEYKVETSFHNPYLEVAKKFYQRIIDDLVLPDNKSAVSKIAFIVVAHPTDTLPIFLWALSGMKGVVAALLLKGERLSDGEKDTAQTRRIARKLKELYKDIIVDSLDRDIIESEEPEDKSRVNLFFENLLENSIYQFVICDHGGYFFNQLPYLFQRYPNRFLCVVEHTLNGEMRYQKNIKKMGGLILPVYSIAKAKLKKYEDIAVGVSMVKALDRVYREGRRADIDQSVKKMLIIGYGSMGRGFVLAWYENERNKNKVGGVYICDKSPEKLKLASQDFIDILGRDHFLKEFDSKIGDFDLIIVAANTISDNGSLIKESHLVQLKSGALIAGVTSMDDFLSLGELRNYRTAVTDFSDYALMYKHREQEEKFFYMAAGGKTLNFLIGSTAHPIMHAVFGLIVACVRLGLNACEVYRQRMDVLIPDEDLQQKVLDVYKSCFGEDSVPQLCLPNRAIRKTLKYIHACLKRNHSQYKIKSPFGGYSAGINEKFLHLQTEILVYETVSKVSGDKNSYANFSTKSLVNHEQASKENRELPIADLFKPASIAFPMRQFEEDGLDKEKHFSFEGECPDRSPRLVLIHGQAGVGKTTLSEYICDQHMRGQLFKEYLWVFLIKLRKLQVLTVTRAPICYSWSLCELIYSTCFFANDLDEGDFKQAWKEVIGARLKEGRGLVILEGYDELPSGPSFKAIEALLNSRIPVLITSRPYGLETVKEHQERREINLMGFTDDNIAQYVGDYFQVTAQMHAEASDTDCKEIRAERFLAKLRENKNIWGIAYTPIMLSLLCHLFADNVFRDFELLQTVGDLYQIMELKLLANMLGHRLGVSLLDNLDAENELKKYQACLAAIAFEGLRRRELVIGHESVNSVLETRAIAPKEKIFFFKKMQHIGFISRVPCNESEEKFQPIVFPHLTWQEYFGAKHLVRLLTSGDHKQKENAWRLMSELLLDPNFQMVFWFITSLLKNKPENLKEFFLFLENSVLYDLGGDYLASLWVKCFYEIASLDAQSESSALSQQVILRLYWQFQSYISNPGCFNLSSSCFLNKINDVGKVDQIIKNQSIYSCLIKLINYQIIYEIFLRNSVERMFDIYAPPFDYVSDGPLDSVIDEDGESTLARNNWYRFFCDYLACFDSPGLDFFQYIQYDVPKSLKLWSKNNKNLFLPFVVFQSLIFVSSIELLWRDLFILIYLIALRFLCSRLSPLFRSIISKNLISQKGVSRNIQSSLEEWLVDSRDTFSFFLLFKYIIYIGVIASFYDPYISIYLTSLYLLFDMLPLFRGLSLSNNIEELDARKRDCLISVNAQKTIGKLAFLVSCLSENISFKKYTLGFVPPLLVFIIRYFISKIFMIPLDNFYYPLVSIWVDLLMLYPYLEMASFYNNLNSLEVSKKFSSAYPRSIKSTGDKVIIPYSVSELFEAINNNELNPNIAELIKQFLESNSVNKFLPALIIFSIIKHHQTLVIVYDQKNETYQLSYAFGQQYDLPITDKRAQILRHLAIYAKVLLEKPLNKVIIKNLVSTCAQLKDTETDSMMADHPNYKPSIDKEKNFWQQPVKGLTKHSANLFLLSQQLLYQSNSSSDKHKYLAVFRQVEQLLKRGQFVDCRLLCASHAIHPARNSFLTSNKIHGYFLGLSQSSDERLAEELCYYKEPQKNPIFFSFSVPRVSFFVVASASVLLSQSEVAWEYASDFFNLS